MNYHIQITSELVDEQVYSADENQYMPETYLRRAYQVCDGEGSSFIVSQFRAMTAIDMGTVAILFEVEYKSAHTGWVNDTPADAHEDQAIGIDWQDDADDIADTGVPACDMDGGGDLPF